MKTISTLNINQLEQEDQIFLQTGPFGTQLKAKDYVEQGIPVINVRNIGFGDVRKQDLEYLGESTAHRLQQHRLTKGDIVFGRKGAVERHALIDETTEGWIQGSDCLRLRLKSDRVHYKYLSYYLRTKGHQDWMQALCSFGATMSSLNQEIVRKISFPAPGYPIQEKIAAVLSAYDDLIEDNNRRIAVLEKMAEELYREWFVRLRFPGHEKTKIVKGVPTGWDVKASSSVLNVLGGGTPNTDIPNYWDGEIPFFTPKDAHTGFFANTTEKSITPAGLENCNSKQYPRNTIFITARGTVGKIVLAMRPMAMNQSCYALEPKTGKHAYHYFLAMRNIVDIIKGTSRSGVFDNIITDSFKQINLFLPPEKLLDAFEMLETPLFSKIETLVRTNCTLTDSRDRLLSRLMSGKIDVEKLGIQFPPSMTTKDKEEQAASN